MRQQSRLRRLQIEMLERRTMLAAFDVLAFSKTSGFRHGSIEAGQAALAELAAAHDFRVEFTEDSRRFTAEGLADFEAVIFLNTTGNVLDDTQQDAFRNYIEGGGGYVGVHAAADTEHNWDWYEELLGAQFAGHPAIQEATIVVADQVHPSTAHLPDRWVRSDEWYNYTANPRGEVHVLATLDESTYNGGTMGNDHPISWYHSVEAGRSWYTGLGHTSATYDEPLFLQHLLGGIEYAAGRTVVDGGATIEDNYEVQVLDSQTRDPMELEFLPDGRVIYVERAGRINIYRPETDDTVEAGRLAVYTGQEDGLLGVALDPQFAETGWIYLFYSPAGNQAVQHVSRFTLEGETLDLASESLVMEIPTQRDQCCHSAGSLAFGPAGNLFIATGDDTNPFESNGFAPIDERPGRSPWDAQKSSANANDLRGKILRVTPLAEGGYSIPEGNLFPADGSEGRPEIYVMGNRNPFRISVDQETGWLYWGDVGPDARNDNNGRGPRGYDEINQARGAGNFGWPYFIGPNLAYRDYAFPSGPSGSAFDPAAPINDSPNNTGRSDLPPAEGAFIWYPYSSSEEFPELGGGGRTAMAGPVYHFDAELDSPNKLPEYFDGTLFIYEWSRHSIFEVKMDDDGEILKLNRILPSLDLNRPMDMEIGPDGAIYLLEWGTTFRGGNDDSQLIRIDFTANVVPPVDPFPGDFNGNGIVEQGDLDLVLLSWGRNAADVPEDWIGPPAMGIVDQNELDAVLLHWGQSNQLDRPPAAAALLAEEQTVGVDKYDGEKGEDGKSGPYSGRWWNPMEGELAGHKKRLHELLFLANNSESVNFL